MTTGRLGPAVFLPYLVQTGVHSQMYINQMWRMFNFGAGTGKRNYTDTACSEPVLHADRIIQVLSFRSRFDLDSQCYLLAKLNSLAVLWHAMYIKQIRCSEPRLTVSFPLPSSQFTLGDRSRAPIRLHWHEHPCRRCMGLYFHR